MDYGYVQAVKNTHTDQCPGIIHCYDIDCQYHVNLHRRVEKGQYLSFRPGLNLIPSIGHFHVHGHQDKCYPRYAPRFVPGAGEVDGEVMERLFSVLNGISSTARTMTLAHRSETLDSHMGDNNFKKMLDMSMSGFCPIAFPDCEFNQFRLCARSGPRFAKMLSARARIST